MYQMLMGQPPWLGMDPLEIMTWITMQKVHPTIPSAVMDALDPHI